MSSSKKIHKKNSRNRQSLIVFVIIFAIIAAALIIAARAAGPSYNLESENGTINSPATMASDSNASAGKYVKFSAASSSTGASSTTPCVHSAPPTQWKHVVVLIFENQSYTDVVGNSGAPFITGLVNKCGTSYSGNGGATPKNNWHDGDYKVNGSQDGSYNSKPSYATLTSGVSPSVSGIIDDTYSTTTTVDNIYKQLIAAGKNGKTYYSGTASSTPCNSSNFSGAYHDPLRYYIPTVGSAYCNSHDSPISTFMNDVNGGALPEFSVVLPTNGENMHDNSVASGDTWAKNFLNPLFDSTRYKSGDTAVFFLWDEDTPIPNVLVAPSIVAGSKVPVPTGNPISHFSANRTFSEMLGIPIIGVSAQAPSLLSFFNGQ